MSKLKFISHLQTGFIITMVCFVFIAGGIVIYHESKNLSERISRGEGLVVDRLGLDEGDILLKSNDWNNYYTAHTLDGDYTVVFNEADEDDLRIEKLVRKE